MVLLVLWRVTAIFLTGGKSVKCSSLENLNTCKHTKAMPKSLNNSIVAENLLSQACVIDAVQGARKTAEMSRLAPVYSGSKKSETERNGMLEEQRK